MSRSLITMLFLALVSGSLMFAEPFEITRGDIKLALYPETGSFTVYKLSDVGKNRYEALYDDRDASATSWFSVLSNGRVFKLAKKTGKPVVFTETATGAKFTYTLTDDFQVEQEFSFAQVSQGGSDPFVVIDTRIENTSGKNGVFALKGLFDTTLGESEGIHFYTDLRNRISAETRLRSGIDSDAWIVSRKDTLTLAILLTGSGVSAPESVYLANWDRLNTLTWNPDFVEGRSFNTIYSINDSAILMIWPEKELRANEKLSIRMVLGSSSTQVRGHADSATGGKSNREAAIKDLLDRIATIEKDPDSVSPEELDRLNAQLDMMLKQGGE